MKLTGALYLNALAMTAVLTPLAGIARDILPPFLPIGERADAPAGFAEMCRRNAYLCALGADSGLIRDIYAEAAPADADTSSISPLLATGAIARSGRKPVSQDHMKPDQAAIVVLGRPAREEEPSRDALFRMLKQVNARVNREVYPVTDARAHGVGEYWDRPRGRYPVGDCEDYAIEKRVRLMEEGFPAARLFYAVVYHPVQGLHTVLIARLSDGDFILDNLTPHILPWSQARFSWLRQQVPGQPDHWVRIGDWRGEQSFTKTAMAKQEEAG